MHVCAHLCKRLPIPVRIFPEYFDHVIRHSVAALVARMHYELLPPLERWTVAAIQQMAKERLGGAHETAAITRRIGEHLLMRLFAKRSGGGEPVCVRLPRGISYPDEFGDEVHHHRVRVADQRGVVLSLD